VRWCLCCHERPGGITPAVLRLRKWSTFRNEVRTTAAQYMPASFLEDDSSVTIG